MNPTAILTGDWHLRSTIPICRKDDFINTMIGKVNFILNLSKNYGVPILIPGDVGHISEWSNSLLYLIINLLKKYYMVVPPIIIPGQHDLPHHILNDWKHSGLGVLSASKCISLLISRMNTFRINVKYEIPIVIYPYPYGVELDHPVNHTNQFKIALMHKMVIKNKPLWKGQKDYNVAKSLLREFPEFNLIVTGDNHIPFTETHNERLLVNCGSLMRTTIEQKNYRPRVYLWYAETNTVKEVFIPIKQDVFKPIDEIIEIDKNTEIFVKALKKNYDINISFEENMKKCLNKNPVSLKVRRKIHKAISNE